MIIGDCPNLDCLVDKVETAFQIVIGLGIVNFLVLLSLWAKK